MAYRIGPLAPVSALLLAFGGQRASAQADLPIRHEVRNGIVAIGWPGLSGIEAASELRYAGGQRFILRAVADVEQHVFVDRDSSGRVTRLLWVQIEGYLPSIRSTYDYSADSIIEKDRYPFRVNVRRLTSPPDSTSDRGALDRLLRRSGNAFPAAVERVRFVAVSADRRREVMIIVADATGSGGGAAMDISAAVERVRRAFRVVP